MSKSLRGINRKQALKMAKFNRRNKSAKRERKSCLTEAAFVHDRQPLDMIRANQAREKFLSR